MRSDRPRNKIIGFEMEANGIWDEMHSIVIKAVSDYADRHKNDTWRQ